MRRTLSFFVMLSRNDGETVMRVSTMVNGVGQEPQDSTCSSMRGESTRI